QNVTAVVSIRHISGAKTCLKNVTACDRARATRFPCPPSFPAARTTWPASIRLLIVVILTVPSLQIPTAAELGRLFIHEPQACPPPGARPSVPLPGEAALLEPHGEHLLGHGPFAVLLRPFLVRGVQLAGVNPVPWADDAAVVQEGGDHVHLRSIALGCHAYFLWERESVALPVQASLHGPGEDPRAFLQELGE